VIALRVAVIGGGRSSEHEISLSSAAAVAGGLRDGGHEVTEITVGRDGIWRAGDRELELAPGRGLLGCDIAFPVLHGPFGEDGTVQGLLECLGVAYVGAGVLASALCMDKVLFKEILARSEVPQVDYRGVRDGDWRRDRDAVLGELAALGLPLFVKPARLGSSVGIAKVAAADELPRALDAAFAHDPLVIAEAMAAGIEVECAVIGHAEPLASEPGEISIEADWYDFEAKYTPGAMELIVPARISATARDRVRQLAVETFRRVDCSGLARVDFFVDGEAVLVNELNTMPGNTPTSVFPKLFAASGLDYPDLLDRLLEYARERHAAQAQYSF
jgi:D-alanine-D-alanine ligase